MYETMERGLYIAASGMLTELQRQDQIANDLANASTSGYKADRSTQRSFGELLLANKETGQNVGSLGLGVEIDQKVTDWSPQPLRQTDEPLDFGIQGEGFFAVRTGNGVFYTRNGQFTPNAQGQLTTARGDVVLSPGGQPVQIGADGKVDPRNIGIFTVANPRKVGDNLVAGQQTGQSTSTAIAGSLEGSGADPAKSMVDMIASFRAFEAGQKVIQTLDETLGKASNNVGTVQ
jgi:flagellar basal-body rod protein FlgF